MEPEAKRVCPACETLIDENETKCPCCGALFAEIPGRAPDESIVVPVTARMVDVENREADERISENDSEGPTDQETKKAGLSKGGIALSALGALGIVAGVLLDPLQNLVDSNHPAAFNIGSTQLAGILVAACVMVIGIAMTFTMRTREG